MAEDFGSWLADQLRERGESQRAFADRTGFALNTVRGWLRAGAQPTWANCDRIARALGQDVDAVRRLAGYDFESTPPLTEDDYELIDGWTDLDPDVRAAIMEVQPKIEALQRRAAEAASEDDDASAGGTNARPRAS